MATVKDLMVKIKADTSDFDRGMDGASQKASSSAKNIKSQVMSLASEYRKAGMTQKEAMTKAWETSRMLTNTVAHCSMTRSSGSE